MTSREVWQPGARGRGLRRSSSNLTQRVPSHDPPDFRLAASLGRSADDGLPRLRRATGSLIAFNNELEHVFAHQLYAKPRPGVSPLDLATLAERAGSLVPHARVRAVLLTEPDQASVEFTPETDPATGKPYALGFDEFYVDPWTGAELGRRTRGDLSEGLINFMPFVYLLHVALMWKPIGETILGVVAVFWTLDCFNGFYLTLPDLADELLEPLETCMAHQAGRRLLSPQSRSASSERPVALARALLVRLVERDVQHAARL